MTAAIQVDHVSKLYKLGTRRSAWRYLLPGMGLRQLDRLGEAALQQRGYFWALRDISLSVERGETVGLIGANGAGKTTLLSILAGITIATRGEVTTVGRMGALIKLGAGFHPELTGRENIYLSGSILGLSRAEIDARYDEIVAFAELEAFIDTPVKRYSSGMFARLGYSVAAHTFPDVLLVDEVLAVGDLAFRNKCYNHMQRLAGENRAIVIVSHTMSMLYTLCDRIVWLDQGQIKRQGDPMTVIAEYLEWSREKLETAPEVRKFAGRGGDGPVRVREVQMLNQHGDPVSTIPHGEALFIDLLWESDAPVDDAFFRLHIRDLVSSTAVTSLNAPAEARGPLPAGTGRARFVLPEVLLIPRKYQVGFSITSGDYSVFYDHLVESDYFFTVEPSERFLAAGNVPWQNDWFTHPHEFTLETALAPDELPDPA